MIEQLEFFGWSGASSEVLARFDGATYEPEIDEARLGRQMRAVRALMLDGDWRTLGEIEAATGYPQASISARLRDLRKAKFGGRPVNRRRRGEPKAGLFEYQVGGKN